ncbi:LOW QUALITY PROTEIN: 11S globulin seed storage protein Jug r 4-like [Salvia hispanica]|uniref:LOW QUALITY PROTEIN: 11S globulin seed storage protein Jug r 4-like n=1 Tax=Salvia hispanica TaxID=49212 RepID=UPI002009A97C|nr:LOW QUALITY PROTEIN: 11S globulin seed storage protein Jug r 4-like [Salvia hispanica]
MAKLSLSLLSFLVLLGFGFGYAIREQQLGECQLSNIDAREPSYRVQSEGGQTEFWDNQNNEFRCAGVSIRRHIIQQRGLLLPVYHNAPVLVYVVQGRGTYGVLTSGCAETFESGQQQQFSREERSQRFRDDKHQKVEEFQKGDVIAIRAGDAHWVYNDGDQELVVVVFHHNSNYANQLDQNPRSFFLAGNPGNEQEEEQYRRLRGSKRGQEAQSELGNVFSGLDDELLAEAFNVDVETARKLRGQNDERGHIIRAEKSIQLIQPHHSRQEQERQHNGLEETFCSARVKENLDRASRADFYNPRAGRFSTLNSFNLPVLSFLQLSAAKGVLHRNAIFSPHWYTNAHTLIYATRGASRVQIVNHRGQAVFDGQFREGQVLVVPQNFAVVKKAAEQGFEWVAFNTNENAAINTLSGRTSAIRGLPVDVVANAYQVSREEAQRIKFSRQETLIFNAPLSASA